MQKNTLPIVVKLVCIVLAVGLFAAIAPVSQAQGPLGNCNGGVPFTDHSGKTFCISQPDSYTSVTRQTSSPLTITPPITTAPNPVVCNGDGSTGYRIQVVYAYVTGNQSQLSTYRTSFQEWAYEVDRAIVDSAAGTGGVRHVRYVHDANCFPVVNEVALSSTTATNFAQTVSELQSLGYNRNDRKYMVFFDAQTYCGISTVYADDSAGQTNINNTGTSYARIDSGCWSNTTYGPTLATHELGHMLGAVQPSAPHASSQNYHCNDGIDVMCDYGWPKDASFSDTICPNSSFLRLYDCGHDDYFNTNPKAGSYLATHWNLANNQFLIYATQTAVRVDSIVTGKLNGSVFTPTDSFNPSDTVVMRVHMADTNGVNASGATTSFTVNQPNGSAQCTFTNKTTDSTGTAQGTCLLPPSATSGSWSGKVSSFTRSPATSANADSVTQHTFNVQNAPTAVTLSSFTAQPEAPVADNSLTLNFIFTAFLGVVVTMGARKMFA